MPLVAWGRYGFGESFVAEIRETTRFAALWRGTAEATVPTQRSVAPGLGQARGCPGVYIVTDTNPTCSIQVSNSLRAASHCNRCRSPRSRTLWCKGGNRSKVMFAG